VKRRVLLRPAADLDLDKQVAYLAERANARIAARFLSAAQKTFRLLGKHPQMGCVTRYHSKHLAGVRMFPLQGFPKHLVFYRPVEHGIDVIRVIHGARDIEALFDDE
jgi:toxin ParE1/3/4